MAPGFVDLHGVILGLQRLQFLKHHQMGNSFIMLPLASTSNEQSRPCVFHSVGGHRQLALPHCRLDHGESRREMLQRANDVLLDQFCSVAGS